MNETKVRELATKLVLDGLSYPEAEQRARRAIVYSTGFDQLTADDLNALSISELNDFLAFSLEREPDLFARSSQPTWGTEEQMAVAAEQSLNDLAAKREAAAAQRKQDAKDTIARAKGLEVAGVNRVSVQAVMAELGITEADL